MTTTCNALYSTFALLCVRSHSPRSTSHLSILSPVLLPTLDRGLLLRLSGPISCATHPVLLFLTIGRFPMFLAAHCVDIAFGSLCIAIDHVPVFCSCAVVMYHTLTLSLRSIVLPR